MNREQGKTDEPLAKLGSGDPGGKSDPPLIAGRVSPGAAGREMIVLNSGLEYWMKEREVAIERSRAAIHGYRERWRAVQR